MKKDKKKEIKVKKTDKVHTDLESVKAMLARALADYDNLSKRVEREREAMGKIASIGILARLLPVLDNLESAQEHLQDSGLAICIGEFKKVLREEGLNEIRPAVGDEFNENTMEAIEVTTGARDNIISELVLTGWEFSGGQIIRPAKVKVSKVNN